MNEISNELNNFLSLHKCDLENPSSPSSCIEEKKHLVKTTQQSCRQYFGKHIPFLWKNNEPIFTIGPHWPLFILTWCGLFSIGVFVIVHLSNQASPTFKLITICVTVWQAFTYLLTALKNPGVVNTKDERASLVHKNSNESHFCKFCNVNVSKDSRHCSACKVCIRGFDHHCPWTGKCIGAGNWLIFYIFLGSTAFYIVFCMVAAANFL